jgi:hypothetical protein
VAGACGGRRKKREYVPSTIVGSVLALIIASWPAVQVWSHESAVNHYFAHLLYLLAGALFGLQTAWWAHPTANVARFDDGGVSS